MCMIVHKHPSKTIGLSFGNQISKTAKEVLAIRIGSEDLFPFNSSDYDVMQSPGASILAFLGMMQLYHIPFDYKSIKS